MRSSRAPTRLERVHGEAELHHELHLPAPCLSAVLPAACCRGSHPRILFFSIPLKYLGRSQVRGPQSTQEQVEFNSRKIHPGFEGKFTVCLLCVECDQIRDKWFTGSRYPRAGRLSP